MNRTQKSDLTILISFPIIASAVSFLFNVNAFTSIFLFFGLPSLYLSLKGKEFMKGAIIFSSVAAIPMIVIIDYIAHVSEQWVIPSSILPYRLFGIVSIEVVVWAVLNVYCVVMFHKYFFDRQAMKGLWPSRMNYGLSLILLLFTVFITLYVYSPSSLHIPYFYLLFGTVLILIPVVLWFRAHPESISGLAKTGAYFFILTLAYEITALSLRWWDFPGTAFIGWVSIFSTRFPLEELVFWITLLAMAVVAHFKFFYDYKK